MSRMDNAPDDWDSYWTKCADCGTKYHASEGGCDCADEDGYDEPCGGREPDEPDDFVDDCPQYYDGTGTY